jgi:hypothetical protein
MRKNLIAPIPQTTPAPDESWLDFDAGALLEVTSEDKEYPVGSVLVSGGTQGRRAAGSGAKPSA